MYTWIVDKNHIALKNSSEILHPDANEVFGLLNGEPVDGIECNHPSEDLPDVKFSKVGEDIVCRLRNGDEGNIILSLETAGNNRGNVDIVDGHIIDQCISGKKWFYVTGCTEELQRIFEDLHIIRTGRITVYQYIELVKCIYKAGSDVIDNQVILSALDKPIDSKTSLPKGLAAKLYRYQETGYRWMLYMLKENKGCILGDEMGLGKTLQVITVMLEMKKENKTPMLVVAPVSLLQNWKRECEKFAPELSAVIHHGSFRTGRYKELEEYDLVVTAYSTVVSDASLFSMINWKIVVLDEAQNIKNAYSDRTKYAKRIPREWSLAVTGTPFENHLSDIWSIIDFINPGVLGTVTEYKSEYPDDSEGASKIEPILSAMMIRRLVENVATDLPEKIVVPQPLNMSEPEAQLYEDFRSEINISEVNGNAIGLASLQKLRMFCTHPRVCDMQMSNSPYTDSVKYQRMCEIVEEIIDRNEKVILFTSYQKMFEIIEKDIPERFGIPVLKINGSTPVEERQTIIDSFNDLTGSALLVLNPRAAGVGLNITSANHVIHYNLEWNPALEDQASARSYRRGQEKTVFIYRLFYENTVEEIVNDRLERKRDIAQGAVIGTDGEKENAEDIIAALSKSPKRR